MEAARGGDCRCAHEDAGASAPSRSTTIKALLTAEQKAQFDKIMPHAAAVAAADR